MVVAMRLLLRAALADLPNQRFMYACEHTVPLYPPTLVYQQLMGEAKSRINACPEREQTNDVSLLLLKIHSAAPKSPWISSLSADPCILALHRHPEVCCEIRCPLPSDTIKNPFAVLTFLRWHAFLPPL